MLEQHMALKEPHADAYIQVTRVWRGCRIPQQGVYCAENSQLDARPARRTASALGQGELRLDSLYGSICSGLTLRYDTTQEQIQALGRDKELYVSHTMSPFFNKVEGLALG